jgi:hypothetical protein
LGNGNLLSTNGAGVWEIEPGTGNTIENKKAGSARFIEFYGPAQEGYALSIVIEGNGTVIKNPDQMIYPPGAPVELTAIPDTGWNFEYWSGDLSGDINPDVINMTGNKTVTAHFSPLASSVNISLYPGWNLITIPLETVWTAEDLGDNITGCTLVLKFQGDTQQFFTHVVNTPVNNFPLENGVGYFVFVTTDSTFVYSGTPVTNVSVHLFTGWNLIGWYNEFTTMAVPLGQNITDCTLVVSYDSQTPAFITCIINPPIGNFPVARGMGLFVFVTSESDWYGGG